MSNIAFLFGSGISIYSDFPKMNEITNDILTGEDIGLNLSFNYIFNYDQPYTKPYVINNIKLVNYIKKSIDDYYKEKSIEHTTNYEDIYYLLRQICDSEDFEFENPALKPFIDNLKTHFAEIIDNESGYTFEVFIEECLRYIHCIVWQKLSISIKTTKQLNILKDFISSGKIKTLNILSLNHDLLIEKFFEINSIDFTDGFEINSKKIPVWNIDLFKNNSNNIKLCKLHGSIDWFNINSTEQITNLYKVPQNINVDEIYTIDKSLQFSDGLPVFLIGTFNKLFDYLGGIYEQLYQLSQNILEKCEYLVISGYSFNDKGININILKWLNSSIAKKIIIIHPRFDSLKKNVRGAYHIYFDPPHQSPFINRKLIKIEKRFEDVEFSELLSKI